MPRKTKKQKMRAALRKNIQFTVRPTIPHKVPETEQKTPENDEAPSSLDEDREKRKYFFNDLKSSFLIILSIIALEILIYFVSIRR